jgi:hypothetical protein
MLCERYKDALIEAAASGVPSGKLREHLAECASCLAAFGQERSLFAAIDTGLHADANATIPPSLLPRVRARLDEVATPRLGWMQPLGFACAGVALAFVVFVMARPHLATQEEMAPRGPVAVRASMATAMNTNREEGAPKSTQIAAVPFHRSHESRNSTSGHAAASSNPEVLVPPDERDGLAQLVASINEHRGLAGALLARVPDKKDSLISVDGLHIDALEVKALEGREPETLDRAGEKH